CTRWNHGSFDIW
nr:immunoglobulin heavy chain junction region [Macaca mulatta]